MLNKLYATADFISDILSFRISISHTTAVSTAMIICRDTTAVLNSSVTLYAGYEGNTTLVFKGYVKQITRQIPEDTVTVTLHDAMVLATDHFIASANPNTPLTFSNISGEALVGAVFEEAGLTSYNYDPTYFTFGIHSPVEVKLVTSYEFNHSIANLLAWSLWSNVLPGGTEVVNFKNRLPYLMATDTVADFTVTNDEIIASSYEITEKDLRNRVVVYGSGDIYAEASEVSPYLPSGFYKTTVYASPALVQDNTMAQQIADYNLVALHKLTYRLSLTIVGRHDITARSVINVTDLGQGISNDLWYAFAVEHNWSRGGFTTSLELRK